MSKIDTVFESLKARVQAREWMPDESLPSRSHLSKEYGVSPATVSIAVRKLKQCGLLEVLPSRGAVIVEPAANGTNLVSPKPTIGLRGSYVPGPTRTGGYGMGVVNALWAVAQEERAPLLLLPNSGADTRLSRQYCQIHGVRGIIFLGGGSYQEAFDLRLEGVPVVIANDPAEPTPLSFVDYDHAGALRQIVQHFYDVGRRRIAVVFSSTTVPRFLEKLKPHFIDALHQHGLNYSLEDYWCFVEKDNDAPPDLHAEAVISETKRLLQLPQPPDAIFYWQPGLSRAQHIQLKNAVECGGWAIPNDVSIACNSGNLEEDAGISGFATNHGELARELLTGMFAAVDNPFHSVQKLIPLPFFDRGTVTPT